VVGFLIAGISLSKAEKKFEAPVALLTRIANVLRR
jgi:hypothetical protein